MKQPKILLSLTENYDNYANSVNQCGGIATTEFSKEN